MIFEISLLYSANYSTFWFRYSEFLYFYDADDEGVLKNETISISLDASDPLLDMFIKRAVSDAIDDVIGNVSSLCTEHLGDGGIDLKMFNVETPILGTEDSDFREVRGEYFALKNYHGQIINR